jgi:hypothetical protein
MKVKENNSFLRITLQYSDDLQNNFEVTGGWKKLHGD